MCINDYSDPNLGANAPVMRAITTQRSMRLNGKRSVKSISWYPCNLPHPLSRLVLQADHVDKQIDRIRRLIDGCGTVVDVRDCVRTLYLNEYESYLN